MAHSFEILGSGKLITFQFCFLSHKNGCRFLKLLLSGGLSQCSLFALLVFHLYIQIPVLNPLFEIPTVVSVLLTDTKPKHNGLKT